MSDAQQAAAAQAAQETALEKSLLDQIVDEGRIAREPEARERGKLMIKEFVSQFLEGEMALSRDAEAMINGRIAQIDHLISLQLNEVMHHAAFQKLEASWRGLKYLVSHTETSENLRIKVFNCSKKELLRDLQRAADFDQSAMFKKVYEEEFGVFGGHPFGTLVGDYEFGKGPEDIELVEKIAQVAAAAHAPFIASATANMFNLDSYTDLAAPRDLAKVFDSTEYAKWKGFRSSDDSRYVVLALPHILMRDPYGKATRPIEEFDYEEHVDGSDHSKYLWGNAAYALAAKITDSFARYNWCSHDPRRGRRRKGGRADRPQLQDRRRRCRHEVPDRGGDHRPAREGIGGLGLCPAGTLQEHRLRRVLQRADGAESQAVRYGRRHRQRAALDQPQLHSGVAPGSRTISRP